ncbi:MAG: hypothetical protein AAF623_17600 [Planctomycetota bacterium]
MNKNNPFTAIAVLFLVSSSLVAQTPEFQLENSIGISRVLTMGHVGRDIGLSDMDRLRLMNSWQVTQQELQKVFQVYQNKSSQTQSSNEELLSDLRDSIREIRKSERDRLASVLDDDQMTRLKQIQFQYMRRNSTAMGGLTELLSLSDEQLQKAKEIGVKLREKMTEVKEGAVEAGQPQLDWVEQIYQIRENAEDELLEILTPAQRQKLNSLEGRWYDFRNGDPQKPSDEEDQKASEDN